MPPFPADHPQRHQLAEEVHARPPIAVPAPARVCYLAMLVDGDARDAERRHLELLCQRWGAAPPAPGTTHFRADLGPLQVKWERHGEFSGYTFVSPGTGLEPPADPVGKLPAGWLGSVQGETIALVQAEVLAEGDAAATLATGSGTLIGPIVGVSVDDDAAEVYTSFKLHEDGATHLRVLNRSLRPLQTGRLLQRLFEIEAYRVLSLLALPIARRQSPRIAAIEAALAQLTDGIARDGAQSLESDESLLHQLTRLSAEVESGIAATQFRFGACAAYHELVQRRIAELRERRLPGLQTVDEFMGRRLSPAVATCATVGQRLDALSERIGQASSLLATRVGIVRERQNQALLASMNQRVKLQLRLQQTVEGLSVAAIVYYAASLVGYLAKGAAAAGLVAIKPDAAVAVSIPLLAAAAVGLVRRARRRAHDPADTAEAPGAH